MSTVALILTMLLILYAFNIDFKRKSNVSYAPWISLSWMLYSAAKPVSVWILGLPSSRLESDYMEGTPIDRNILSVLLVLSLFIIFKRRKRCISIFKKNILIVVWFLYCGVSILWSDFPAVSFRRWLKEIGLFLSVLLVLTEDDPIESAKILLRRFTYIAIPVSVLLIWFFPKYGVAYSLDSGTLSYLGIAQHKNGLGRICVVSGMFFIWHLITTWRIKKSGIEKKTAFIELVFLIPILGLLLISKSVTSFSVLAIGMIVFTALGIKTINRNVKYFGTVVISCLIIAFIVQSSFDVLGMFVKSQGRDMTFTGRTVLWNDLLTFRTDPLIGVGYGSFWLGERLAIIWERYTWLPNESHNGYLNVYLELGVIGLCLLIAVVYYAFRNIKKSLIYSFDYGRFRMAVLFIALLYNFTEDAVGKMTLMWFVFLLISIDVPQEQPLNYVNEHLTSSTNLSTRQGRV